MRELGTYAPNTWCPGCGNFAILNAIKSTLNTLCDEGLPLENVVLVSGIGCNSKIVDYIDVNSFYSLHGRVLPVATGIKIADDKLKVIGHAGDGDAYGEGLEHLIFTAKRNIDVTVIIHNNRVYGLTTGQYTPTSPLGFKGRSTPFGTKEMPINPLELMIASGATYVGRGTSHGMDLLKGMFKEAILHKGFSVIDVLQVCVTYYNMYEYYDKHVYELKDHDTSDFDKAMAKAREWDYNSDAKIPLGVFYKKEAPSFDEYFAGCDIKKVNRDFKIRQLLDESK